MNKHFKKLQIGIMFFKYNVILIVFIIFSYSIYNITYRHYQTKKIDKKFTINGEVEYLSAMKKISFITYDKNNNSYNVKADLAIEKDKFIVEFSNIKGDFLSKNKVDDKKNLTQFDSKLGYFNKNKNIFEFTKKLTINRADNTKLEVDKALFMINEQKITGENNIKFQNSNISNLVADKFIFLLKKKKYKFYHNIKAKIINSEKKISYLDANFVEIDDINLKIFANQYPKYSNEDTKITAKNIFINYKRLVDGKLQIKNLIAQKNVKIISKDTIITGNFAKYFPKRKIIKIKDNVLIKKEGSIVKGDTLIYDIVTENVKILKTKNKIFLKNEK